MERIDRIKLGYYSEFDLSKCELFDYSEDLGLVKLESGKFAYFNKAGYQAIPDLFDEAESFKNGCAQVTKNGETYFINKLNEKVYPKDYEYDDGYSEGLKVVQRRDGKYIYVDKNGDIAIPLELEYAENFKNGLGLVKLIREGYTFINKAGISKFKRKYKYLTELVDGLTIATIEDDNHIYIDINENQVVPGKYQGTTRAFSEGFTPVSQPKNHVFYYYINKAGEDVFERRFKIAGDFHCERARVGEFENKYNQYIDTQGNTIKLMLHNEFYIEDKNELALKIKKLREENHEDITIEGYYTYFVLGNITVVVFDEDYNEYLKKIESVENIINQQLKEDNIQSAAEVHSTLKLVK